MLSISVIQLLHAHHDEHAGTKSGEAAYAIALEKCQVCDFMVHKQQKEFLLTGPQSLDLPHSFPVAGQMRGMIVFYKFTLSGFTNKGPPSIFAFS